MTDRAIAEEILRRTAERGPAKSICPSEVARGLEPDEASWRRLMPRVREAAAALARDGRVEILRKGKPVDPAEEIRGVIRLRWKEHP
ncbi:DUF3253 domain-containing protein [Leptolyngbya sp. 15MV]|nr:DUF3253 domain-containing protein [Leptolyngbya sp. 15MV]